ncbi:uncharacterized protein LOC108102278 [Drosophila ficusphila]|uniref:uncharacterized protein LOC108102278 n=1 Tax=Drosophila ficusphila TaxID=30025 RepID=UPI0007E6C870|nr:uncharacterized protein LOC108102278 [Drosophila ficusphila]
MPRRVVELNGFEPAKKPCPRKSKLDPKGKCGAAVKQSSIKPREQPVEPKSPLQFLQKKSDAELVLHWARSEGRTCSPIKLLPPW